MLAFDAVVWEVSFDSQNFPQYRIGAETMILLQLNVF